MKVSRAELQRRQALSLDDKVRHARRMIHLWHDHYEGMVYVAFSGGKDSTVLLHLVRSMLPSAPAVFCNTGLEFPEIVAHVDATENVTVLRPKMTYRAVIERYGYPVVSKETAQRVEEIRSARAHGNDKWVRRQMYGERPTGQSSFHLARKWRFLVSAPFKISERCCDVMKKNPMHSYARETGRAAIIGTMAADSIARRQTYLEHGCNAHDARDPSSRPLSIWSEADVWEYIRSREVPYSSIYDAGYERTGCVFCAFGAHMEKPPNRFQRLQETHPRLWRHCMDALGMREVLEFVGVPWRCSALRSKGPGERLRKRIRARGGRP